ncbi:hypothetical protein Prudu_014664 [Prunus dulcis]|uniref:Uncharacterized protein n=1 Tax=Prunus dulcis TaxID=3755 RepID=A0A4Y1RIK1_PRUDU|nr:hypothetical protein Prudu_014664 [Prunus dulcis]
MGDRNISQQPSAAAAALLTSGQDVQVSALMMVSRQHEVLQNRKEMEKSLAVLFAQQTQLIDLTKSMSEQLRSLETSPPETTAIPNSTSNKKALIPKRRQACWFSLMEDYMHGLQVEEGHWHTRFPIAAGPLAVLKGATSGKISK